VTLSGGDGGDGGSAAAGYYYAGGGGGGGGGYGLLSAGAFSNYGTIRGGAVGNGGHGSQHDGGGGQAGAGGVGAQASSSFQNEGMILGGHGGQGGDGDVAGAGGVGGAGLVFSNGLLFNTGTITGGNAGLRGSSNISNTDDPGDAAGGAGLVGADVTVYNNGTISGGLDADGSRAPAVIFTAGNSKLVITADSVLTGAVRSEGEDELAFAGAGGLFSLHHLNALDSGALFQGFENLGVEGGVWVFNGAPSLSGIDFSIRGGATMNLAGDLFTGSEANGADPSDINVLFAGTLTGGGQAYNVDVVANGTLAPGDGVGTLKTAMLTLQHASTVRFELGAIHSDKLEVGEVVFGTSGIGGAYLQLSTVAGDRPAIGQVITLIENYTSSATQGTFLLLPDDQVGENGGVRFTISYDEDLGGDVWNNDVTLTVLDLAPAPLSASVNGSTLVLTLDEALGGDGPDASLFSVNVAGVSRAVTAVAVAGDQVTLTLASAVSNGETVTLDYSDFSASNDGDVLEDATGLDSASFSGFAVTNTTPAPSGGGGGGVSAPVTEADVGRVFSALTLPIPDGEAASVVAAIKAGTLTLDAYIASLIPRVQDTMLPALVVSQFFGSTPSQEHLAALSAFNAEQLAAYTKQGVLEPRIGPYEALGLGVSETIAFGGKYAALSDTDFVAKAYQDVFGRLPGADQAKHFAAQILYFETLYAGAGQTTAQADLHAKGAILGQMLGFAAITEAANHDYDDAAIAFLQSAAKGQAQYGEGMLI
jgi:uncharacterized repeat protein (TIGR02059 family)